MGVPEILIDLTRAPGDRWALTPALRRDARELSDAYYRDLGITEDVAEAVAELARPHIPEDYWQEIAALSSQMGLSPLRGLINTAYYDLIKPLMGCTAFAIDTPEGPLHARNLDWWTDDRLLQRASVLCRFVGGPAGEFVTIGWPGFIGAFSGMAPGRFAITLNSVLSEEPAQVAMPVVLLIRRVLEETTTFDAAVARLAETVIPCDCLLLVSGTQPGEFCVIERSPTQHAIRRGASGSVAVANDFLQMDLAGIPTGEIQATSCARFDRITERLQEAPPDVTACLDLLSDDAIAMDITVQQMAFRARTGTCMWRTR